MAKKPVAAAAPVIHATQELPPAMDYAEHERTYHGFMSLSKYAVIATGLFLVLLYFIVRP